MVCAARIVSAQTPKAQWDIRLDPSETLTTVQKEYIFQIAVDALPSVTIVPVCAPSPADALKLTCLAPLTGPNAAAVLTDGKHILTVTVLNTYGANIGTSGGPGPGKPTNIKIVITVTVSPG